MSDQGTEALVLQFSWVYEVVARLQGVVYPFWRDVVSRDHLASWNLV
jgi:hypothetical protein